MPVFRIERTRDYTVMSNHHLKNPDLSLKAKGLLSMMLSFPDGWNYSERGLASICKEGVDAIHSAIKELESTGYMERHQLRGKGGRIVDTEYVIYEKPHTPDMAPPDTENPDMDSETGAPLQGAEFTLYNEHMAEVIKGTTDENGLVVFAGLPLGPYYCQETNAPPGYFPEGSIEQFYLDANGKVVTLSYTNAPARGSIKIIKKNEDGELLSGVEFTLYDADKNEIRTGTTDENGVLVFDGLSIGDYWYAETSELPGYFPNHNLMAARVGYHTAVDERTVTNYKAHGVS